MNLVTTFSPDYYDRYGREAVASMAEYWPGPVIAYVEREVPPDMPSRFECRDLYDDPDFVCFVNWTGACPIFQGKLPDGGYSYHFNAHKFGRKVFAVTDKRLRDGPFVFLGADVHIHKPIPKAFLEGLLQGKAGAFLLRNHLGVHVESDFAGYDPRHPKMALLLDKYRAIFINGGFLLLRGWHDCAALDTLLDFCGLSKEINNISAGVRGDDPKGLHVWPKTVLAEYMTHLKGRIKKDPVLKQQALKMAV